MPSHKICGLQKRVKIEEWRVEITKKAPFSDRTPQIVWSEATLALPLGELAAPWGQTERVPRHNYPLPTLNRGTLSVSLFG